MSSRSSRGASAQDLREFLNQKLKLKEERAITGFLSANLWGLLTEGQISEEQRVALDEFSSITRFRVPFCDIDMLQHVNNAAYVVWAETARCVYFDEVLHESLTGASGMVVAKLEVIYERALTYREHVAIGCRVTRIGRKSFDFLFEIWSEDTSQRAAYCHTTLVAFNFETKSSVMIPEKWRELIAAHEVVAPITGVSDNA